MSSLSPISTRDRVVQSRACVARGTNKEMVVFVPVGDAADVAVGEMRVYQVEGARVTVANSDGRLYAFDDTCTHLGCSLANGTLDGTTVTCACHGSQFDVTTGAVLRGPAQRPIRSRGVRIEGDALLAES